MIHSNKSLYYNCTGLSPFNPGSVDPGSVDLVLWILVLWILVWFCGSGSRGPVVSSGPVLGVLGPDVAVEAGHRGEPLPAGGAAQRGRGGA